MYNKYTRGRSYKLEGAYFFMSFHQNGSITDTVRKKLKHLKSLLKIRYDSHQRDTEFQLNVRRKLFRMYEHALEEEATGSKLLQQFQLAQQVKETFKDEHGKSIDVLAYSILPNHVHLVCEILEDHGNGNPWSDVMRKVKSKSARRINDILQTGGSFWDSLNYEHPVFEDEDLLRIIQYVVRNPVKLGIANSGNAWKWTYVKPEIQEVLADMAFGKVG